MLAPETVAKRFAASCVITTLPFPPESNEDKKVKDKLFTYPAMSMLFPVLLVNGVLVMLTVPLVTFPANPIVWP